ncbi:MAG: polyprenyl synthetase family protein, partial [Bacteroidota bacterium]|nr:polyprenyl synthetase family protein [Bacteroidota bacterium]
VDASQNDIKKMTHFGEKIGMAFQIKDDLFDYGQQRIGKPTGIDIRERKMTLPLIYTMEHASSSERRWLKRNLKKNNKNKKIVKEVIAFVKSKGGLEYSISKMHEFQQEAISILDSFPASESKDSLKKLVSYVIDREF